MTSQCENDANTDAAVSRRSVLETAGGLVAGSTALAALGTRRGAAATDDDRLRAELRERNDDYVAVEVRSPTDTFDDLEFPDEVFLGDAEQFAVHDDEDAVSLPADTEQLATPVEVDSLDADDSGHGKLMYFRTADVDWPEGYEGVGVTLAVGAFPERTVPGDQWDTCPGLWTNVREMTEDRIVVEGRLPDGMATDDAEFPDEVFLGGADQFVVHEDEDAVSLPGDTDGLATPVEMDFDNPHEVTAYFRTDDVDLSATDGEVVTLGIGVFGERTVPGDSWYRCPGHRDY